MKALREMAANLGIALDDRQLALFDQYYELLTDWNRRVNLTRIIEPDAVAIQHFLDSLTCLLVLRPDDARPIRLIDVGSGAGFPGIPLKIARPAWHVTLLESVGKKAAFLRAAIEALGLSDVAVVVGRAEDVAREPGHRSGYDVAVARAVAPLATLAEYCMCFLKPGGSLIAQKTAGNQAELREATRAIALLGGELVETRPVDLPGLAQPRLLVVVRQRRICHEAYPRRAGLPAKNPLGVP